MSAKVGYLVIDAAEPVTLARFWCGLLAVTVDTEIGDGEFLVLSPTDDGLTVGFQRVADVKLGKNRVHLASTTSTSTSCPPPNTRGGARCIPAER